MNKIVSTVFTALILMASNFMHAMLAKEGGQDVAAPKVVKLLNRGFLTFPAYGHSLRADEGYTLVLYDLDDIKANVNLSAQIEQELTDLKMRDPNAHQVLYMYSGPNQQTVTTIPFKKKGLEIPYTYNFAYGLQFNTWF